MTILVNYSRDLSPQALKKKKKKKKERKSKEKNEVIPTPFFKLIIQLFRTTHLKKFTDGRTQLN